jgi:acetylornithine deacetylase/succinyl-diaminopimelate desuccinylase-like protein
MNWESITAEAVEHLQALIRFDTTNPPGNERQAADYLAHILSQEGYEPTVLESRPGRANLIARYRGSGEAPPLLLLSHLDVVPAEPEHWQHPPFSGKLVDGSVWGRGALDMKSITAMQLMTMLLLQRGKVGLKRDVILAATADEEAGGVYGAKFLVDHHLDKIQAGHALSELGGFPVRLAGKRFYLCQVAEKGSCAVKMRARGTPGHGSVPIHDNAIVKLARAVTAVSRHPLPVHPTRPLLEMVEALARSLGGLYGLGLRLLPNPLIGPALLHLFVRDPEQAAFFRALLRNTATPTVVQAGSRVNVIPGSAEVELDVRILPGHSIENVLDELRVVVGSEVELEVAHVSHGVATTSDTPLFDVMERGLLRHDPGAAVVPAMLTGATDARHLARAGIPCYGFSPMRLPPDMSFLSSMHGHDERIPVSALAFGVQVLYEVVTEFCQTARGDI